MVRVKECRQPRCCAMEANSGGSSLDVLVLATALAGLHPVPNPLSKNQYSHCRKYKLYLLYKYFALIYCQGTSISDVILLYRTSSPVDSRNTPTVVDAH